MTRTLTGRTAAALGIPLLFALVLLVRVLTWPPDFTGPLGADLTVVRALILVLVLVTVGAQLRGRNPWWGLVTSTLLGTVTIVAGFPGPGALLPAAWSLYRTARDQPARTLVPAAALVLLTTSVASTVALDRSEEPPPTVLAVLSLGLAIAVGIAVRNRRDALESLRERAVRAEASRDEEARRRVAEDRLRIARELHDVIAHHMAVVSVQTSVAQHHLRTDPDEAENALAHVRRSSGLVLEELGEVLAVLRSADAPLSPAPARTATLPGLPDLLDGFASSGTPIRSRLPVDAFRAAAPAEQAVYRLIQESLTNAHRHAPGAPVDVEVQHVGTVFTVTVRNGPSSRRGAPSRVGSGVGLAGLRERVTGLGGTFAAGPDPAGGFEVSARIPAEPVGPSSPVPPDREEPAS